MAEWISMRRNKLDFDAVKRLALGLSGVEESTAYGSPALKVRGKLLACIAVHKSAEPDSLVVCIDFDRRAEMLADSPEVYYLTDHYVNHPAVLVRLSRVHPDALRDLLGMSWRFVTAKEPGANRGPRRGRKDPSALFR